ncbi:MAG: hypothetical protein WCL14_03370 [Bacteroidota bacterium]
MKKIYIHLFLFLEQFLSAIVYRMIESIFIVLKQDGNYLSSFLENRKKEGFVFLFIARPLPGGMAR